MVQNRPKCSGMKNNKTVADGRHYKEETEGIIQNQVIEKNKLRTGNNRQETEKNVDTYNKPMSLFNQLLIEIN